MIQYLELSHVKPIIGVKDPKFNIQELHSYTLNIQLSYKDFQLSVIDSRNNLLVLEDVRIQKVTSSREYFQIINDVFDSHQFLRAGFWKKINIAIKTEKFSIIPNNFFNVKKTRELLSFNCDITDIEEVLFCEQVSIDATIIYALHSKLYSWIKGVYPSKKVNFYHQTNAIIQSILIYNDTLENHKQKLFCDYDRGKLFIVALENDNLIFFNQFILKKSEDYLRYILMVMNELKFNRNTAFVYNWGSFQNQERQVQILQEKIVNVESGKRVKNLNYSFHFDEIHEHQFFSLLGLAFL